LPRQFARDNAKLAEGSLQHTVFYSWQSDLDPALTRNFIEDALNRAAKRIAADGETTIDPVIDRDTSGVGGTPDISETIFRKIDQCDVFVCDISIINQTTESPRSGINGLLFEARRRLMQASTLRPVPNPNVLLELGYASARLGWSRIILVQNTAFGSVEQLPFDLRGRRIISYRLSSREARREIRPELRQQIDSTLRQAISSVLEANVWKGINIPRWFGIWVTPPNPNRKATLLIREVGARGFLFHISLVDGGRTGTISGFAAYTGPDSAYAVIVSATSKNPCEVRFRRANDGKRIIHVDESYGCHIYKGMDATFDGSYTCYQDLLFDSGALDEMDVQRLYLITGKRYREFLDSFQQIGERPSLDTFMAKTWRGGVKGFYTIIEAIVMRGENGELWAAYIDNDVVRYFTTENAFKKRMPQTIEKWRERFPEKEVVYEKNSAVIPGWAQHFALGSQSL
jgi:hypothetical protein